MRKKQVKGERSKVKGTAFPFALRLLPFALLFISPVINAGDGHLFLYNYHADEVLDVTYKTPKGYDKEALEKINNLMRSPDDKVFPISPQLIDLIDDIQDHFAAEAIEIISGYRSPQYNRELKQNGRTVASESLHMKGIATDIHIDEITEKALGDYVISLKRGGVGIYPPYSFVHVDLGPVRTWGEEGPKKRVLVGMDANPNQSWKAITDKNEYRRGEPVKVAITNVAYEKAPLTVNVWYEHFRKGQWAEHELIDKKKKKRIVKPGEEVAFEWKPSEAPFGKYRLVIFTSGDFNIPPAYSNEFYIKKND